MSEELRENDVESKTDADEVVAQAEVAVETDAAEQDETAEQTEEVAEAEATAQDEDAEKDEADTSDGDGAARSEHDARVAAFAETLAALVAKGEQVMSELEEKAKDADAAFAKRTAKANENADSFSAAMEQHFERAASQLSHDLEIIAAALNKNKEDAGEAPRDEGPYEAVFTPAAADYRKRMGVGFESGLLRTDPEFVERFSNFAFDDVPSDVDLPDRTRFMCWLATLLGCQGVDEYRKLLPAALNMGVEPEAAKEIVYQAVAYLGMGRVYPFLEVTNEVFWYAGIELPLKPQATTKPEEESRYAGGEEAQVACFGEQMRGYKDRGAQDYPHIAQWLVKNCFGDWYARGGLTIAEREMCTFCYIAAQGGCEAQLKAHASANVQCGNDREFLIKVVSNNVPFIGYPRSLNAMAAVEEVTGKSEE